MEAGRTIWLCRLLAGLLIGGATGLRLFYLANGCPLDLAPDEAHYWDWARHLDLSYYSKGPLVAWLIRGSVLLMGLFGQDGVLAVRMPAALCGTGLLASTYVLTVQVYGREKLAVLVVALGLTLPGFAAVSTLMTIDAPYLCCWGWALVLGYQAVFRQAAWAWPAAGLVVGLGILAKYPMVLWLPSLGLFLLASPDYRRQLLRPGFWVLTGVATACCLPIMLWNVQHDWISWRHVQGQAGLNPGTGLRLLGPVVFIGGQFGLLLGFWFAAWLVAMFIQRPGSETRPGVGYLWWMSAPLFVVFLVFSLRNGGGEVNWPVAAYLSGLVLTMAWLFERLRSAGTATRRWLTAGLATTCLGGVLLSFVMHHPDWALPLLARLAGPPTEQRPLPLRRLDPTCRLRGWQTLAAEVDRLREALRRQGIEPVLAATRWTLPGELGFYCSGQPTVYSLGIRLGDRHSQYDLWRPNPAEDGGSFAGQTFIVVTPFPVDLEADFESLDAPRLVTHTEQGQPIACWSLIVGRGFRPAAKAEQHAPGGF